MLKMNLPRRKFLLKSALGILAASLLPASISFLNRKDEHLRIEGRIDCQR